MGGSWGMAFALVPDLWDKSSKIAALTGVQQPFWSPNPIPKQVLQDNVTGEQITEFFHAVSALYFTRGGKTRALSLYHGSGKGRETGKGKGEEPYDKVRKEAKRLMYCMTRGSKWNLPSKLQEHIGANGVSLWTEVQKTGSREASDHTAFSE